MPRPLPPLTLRGRHVHLEPLAAEHAPALAAAAAIDRSTYDWTLVPDGLDGARAYIDDLLADRDRGHVLPFAQRDAATGGLVGCTRFMEPMYWSGRASPDEIEIGGTWLAATAQRTPINTEAKLLLLTQAFDGYGVGRVAICTDARNERSRIAIERIGATFEGVLRRHRPTAGSTPFELRDSAMYSIVADEWPAIAGQLRSRV